MANIQAHIIAFDEKIRLKNFEQNSVLREKRDAILRRLRDKFTAWREEKKAVPTFETFNQGSYQMGTGIEPADGDYDIDVGLRFNAQKDDYADPVALKILVADALEGHTDLGTVIRRSCVTVKYKVNGEQGFHVDLAVYAYEKLDSPVKTLFIAKGKRDSDKEHRIWEVSDPQGLIKKVDEHFSDKDDEVQFLRVIRLFKRWKSEKFKTDGNNAPTGIGLTIAALQWFQPAITRDAFAKTVTCDDLKAMRTFCDAMIKNFTDVGLKPSGQTLFYRLRVNLPVAPYNDIFAKMTDGQMTTFRERLIQMRDCLDEVINDPDEVSACKRMQKLFGEEFAVPKKEDTAQSGGRAIAKSGVSA